MKSDAEIEIEQYLVGLRRRMASFVEASINHPKMQAAIRLNLPTFAASERILKGVRRRDRLKVVRSQNGDK